MGFDASEQKHIEAWDALKAEDTYTAFHSRMENSVGTLFFSAWKKYVFPIYMIYNGKGRKDALPMKF